MENLAQIRKRGKTLTVPSISIDGRTVVITGKILRTAAVMDEELVAGAAVPDPERLILDLRRSDTKADLFVFSQGLTDVTPRYSYHLEWDNAAVVPLSTYQSWWNAVPQETRRNVRRAAKLGVHVGVAAFNDELIDGIVSIYNETPVRQGRRFWHYGKDFQAVRNETATYRERSEFIGAYFGGELIGFIKLVYVDQYASILHILSKNRHADKRPTNALIAKAVDICASKRLSYLVYCKYVYGENAESPLTEFKRRNGFEQLRYPRYYVPLTFKGRVALGLRLHHGLANSLPNRLRVVLRRLRKSYFDCLNKVFRMRPTTSERNAGGVTPRGRGTCSNDAGVA